MSECVFELVSAGRIRCTACGTERAHEGDPTLYRRPCPAGNNAAAPSQAAPPADSIAAAAILQGIPCRHRGEVVERGTCNVCGSRGQPLEVFACAVHGRCMLRRLRNDRPDLTVCWSCHDFQGLPPASPVEPAAD
jgi:hypothetical protein